jgi:[acyl-carrier-protein] S-malonyltransferase
MQPAYDGLKEQLQALQINVPKCPIYSNYTAKATMDPEKIRRNVLNQLLNPVKWTQTMRNMHEDGAESFMEVGPGKVLQGLVKRTLDDVEIDGRQ